jgi:hypothetical protein
MLDVVKRVCWRYAGSALKPHVTGVRLYVTPGADVPQLAYVVTGLAVLPLSDKLLPCQSSKCTSGELLKPCNVA